jgi:hypothetical protein
LGRETLDVRQIVLSWGAPNFEIGFILAALAGYMASMIESCYSVQDDTKRGDDKNLR